MFSGGMSREPSGLKPQWRGHREYLDSAKLQLFDDLQISPPILYPPFRGAANRGRRCRWITELTAMAFV